MLDILHLKALYCRPAPAASYCTSGSKAANTT